MGMGSKNGNEKLLPLTKCLLQTPSEKVGSIRAPDKRGYS